jgi:hypothetical protein
LEEAAASSNPRCYDCCSDHDECYWYCTVCGCDLDESDTPCCRSCMWEVGPTGPEPCGGGYSSYSRCGDYSGHSSYGDYSGYSSCGDYSGYSSCGDYSSYASSNSSVDGCSSGFGTRSSVSDDY